MISIRADLSPEIKILELHTFADLHIGDKFCDIDLISDRIKAVKENPNAYIILNGDIINNATKTSVSDCYAEELTPMAQIDRYCRLFDGVKDRILAVTQGNHERRTYNKEGIDLSYIASKELGISDKYSSTGALLFIRFGELSNHRQTHRKDGYRKAFYTVYCAHGSGGGGRKEGGKAVRLADMASIIDADIYIHSHTHLPMIMKQAFYRTDCTNSTFAKVDKLFVNTSACLDYGGYGEAFEFKPSSKDTPIIYLNGTKKEMNARL